MRSVAEVAGTVVKRSTEGDLQDASTPIAAAVPAMWLRRLWERMVALYGHAWTHVHGVSPQASDHDGLTMSGSTWAGVLAGLSGSQISKGVQACIDAGGEFPPNAPSFRALCLGIPPLATVRSELRHGEPSPFARALWAELDAFRYRQASAEQADRMLRDAYDVVHARVMRGEPLPVDPVAEIAHEKRESKPATPEQAAGHIASIRALLHGGAP